MVVDSAAYWVDSTVVSMAALSVDLMVGLKVVNLVAWMAA